jgi:hypothetical protein
MDESVDVERSVSGAEESIEDQASDVMPASCPMSRASKVISWCWSLHIHQQLKQGGQRHVLFAHAFCGYSVSFERKVSRAVLGLNSVLERRLKRSEHLVGEESCVRKGWLGGRDLGTRRELNVPKTDGVVL